MNDFVSSQIVASTEHRLNHRDRSIFQEVLIGMLSQETVDQMKITCGWDEESNQVCAKFHYQGTTFRLELFSSRRQLFLTPDNSVYRTSSVVSDRDDFFVQLNQISKEVWRSKLIIWFLCILIVVLVCIGFVTSFQGGILTWVARISEAS